MKQKGIKLHSLIFEDLSGEELNKINQIKANKEAKPDEIYRHCGTKKVSWDSMRRLLKSDTKDQSKRWINNEVINSYFKKYLTEVVHKRCRKEPEQNRSGFLGLLFWQTLTDEKHNDMTVQGSTIIIMFLDG